MSNLSGKKGLVIGIANEHSIAWGCAKALYEEGAEVAITYQTEKAKQFVEPLASQINPPIFLPLDVQDNAQMENLFHEITQKWGELDFLVHSIAFAPKEDLHGRVVDCSREGFLQAMDISCYSFIKLANHAEKLIKNGGSIITISYYGGEKVVENYNIMGPVKAALESTTKYLAAELGNKKIRVNVISAGTIQTRAASGIEAFDKLVIETQAKSPEHETATIEDVGEMVAFLVSDKAKHITGDTIFIDSGYHIMGA